MNNLNLVLRFKLNGDRDSRVVGATRITVDGRGALLFYDHQSGAAEPIRLSQVQSMSIHRAPKNWMPSAA